MNETWMKRNSKGEGDECDDKTLTKKQSKIEAAFANVKRKRRVGFVL